VRKGGEFYGGTDTGTGAPLPINPASPSITSEDLVIAPSQATGS